MTDGATPQLPRPSRLGLLRPPSARWWPGAALAGLTLLAPVALTDSQLTVYVDIALFTAVVSGLSLLMGFAGQVSLGQGAFFAIGAYSAALLAKRAGVPPLAALAFAAALTAAIAALVGLPLLRLRGHYLAFATLAFHLIVLSVIGEASGLTGGDTGLPGIPTLSLGPVALTGSERTFAFAYVAWGLAAGTILFNRNLVHSRPGRGLRALATSEVGAVSVGVPVVRYKLKVFALSAAYAGLAGGVYGYFVSYIAPGSFPILLSIQFLIMAAVGGLRSVWGAPIGAAIVFLTVQVLAAAGTLPGMPLQAPAIFSYAVYAVVLILIVLLLPQGIVPSLDAWVARLRRRRFTLSA
ncbi:MAG: branched-chain amino acid ABC transporter permease [Candidatus Dormibacteraeota bacterium]|nr:branched-chain amino acid ABC transporter permease [Candidatus Dormibacteraeota bacterium]